eukprot:gnl/TRDRNA2_/TRDRNA2_94046_c0_seq2.p1 gnl/TRDRNA2_/TRDRNA2_94046_c0~~gnl/TRDRNA2_/TRDRNA2_94046_c0_seq2.p1  ORF type:complete len:562 (-),score=59.75 gnl/TRDRNA2_/TRDRNA2_94046_c0_seq2:115-1548(-)
MAPVVRAVVGAQEPVAHDVEALVVHEEPPPPALSDDGPVRSNFDVLVFRNSMSRRLFRDMVAKFEAPEEGNFTTLQRFAWSLSKRGIKNELKDETLVPVLAVKDGFPLAAGIYTRAQTNDDDTWVLEFFIRNGAAQDSMGGWEAILCHLIRHSQNSMGVFNPLKVIYPINVADFEKLGCIDKGDFYECGDPNPPACEQYANEVFNLDSSVRFSTPVRPRMTRAYQSVARIDQEPEAPAAVAQSMERFNVMVLNSLHSKTLFRNMVSKFEYPGEEEPFQLRNILRLYGFKLSQQRMEKETDDGKWKPMLVVTSNGPCAAALYSDADDNEQGATTLEYLVRNKGDNCIGADDAVMCHLIRNSKSGNGEYRPLNIAFPLDFLFYEAFGCHPAPNSSFGSILQCTNRNPEKCSGHPGAFFYTDGDMLRYSEPQVEPVVLGQASRDVISSAIGFFAASGFLLVLLHFRRGKSTAGTRALLST